MCDYWLNKLVIWQDAAEYKEQENARIRSLLEQALEVVEDHSRFQMDNYCAIVVDSPSIYPNAPCLLLRLWRPKYECAAVALYPPVR